MISCFHEAEPQFVEIMLYLDRILVRLSTPSGRPLGPLSEENLKGKVSIEKASAVYREY
jgi:hypothetical protein